MRYLVLTFCALTLQACSSSSLYTPGTLTPSRAQVIQHKFSDTLTWDQADSAYMRGIAENYDRRGDGAVSLLVTFDPAASNATKASAKAAQVTNLLRSRGIHNIRTELLPVNGQNALGVSYNYYTAQGPKDCQTMPGYSDTDIGGDKDFPMGCTVETLIARQVHRPKDLLGVDVSGARSEGRSASNLVNAVRAGTFNEPLGGSNASSN